MPRLAAENTCWPPMMKGRSNRVSTRRAMRTARS
jgi:hypothetical protein